MAYFDLGYLHLVLLDLYSLSRRLDSFLLLARVLRSLVKLAEEELMAIELMLSFGLAWQMMLLLHYSSDVAARDHDHAHSVLQAASQELRSGSLDSNVLAIFHY